MTPRTHELGFTQWLTRSIPAEHEVKVFVGAKLKWEAGEPGSLAIVGSWAVDSFEAIEAQGAADVTDRAELDAIHSEVLRRAGEVKAP